ncbi:MAG: hypothetical protein NVSMB43_17150 [Pseudarthrobacter sp.]
MAAVALSPALTAANPNPSMALRRVRFSMCPLMFRTQVIFSRAVTRAWPILASPLTKGSAPDTQLDRSDLAHAQQIGRVINLS